MTTKSQRAKGSNMTTNIIAAALTGAACVKLNNAADKYDAEFRAFVSAMAADKSQGATNATIAAATSGRWSVCEAYVRAHVRVAQVATGHVSAAA